MKWTRKTKSIPKNLTDLTEILLKNRGVSKKDSEDFFDPVHPNQLTKKQHCISKKTLDSAKKILTKAISEDEKIVVFGDYDADGICASAILWQTLYYLYNKHHRDGKNFPVPFIPHREEHGYGLSIQALAQILEEQKPDLIVTVDNGIVAHDAAAYVKKHDVGLIITDHHEPEKDNTEEKYPEADCIVHSTKLCGASVAWMLANALDTAVAEKSLDLAGIATIADQVPLQAANRSFAYHGVQALQNSKRVGLLELLKTMRVQQEEITEWSVGFGIAPRINAMGRMEHGLDALRLLCTTNQAQAQKLAAKLSETNTYRQDVTSEMKEDAIAQAKEQVDESIIIVSSSEYHEGVIGLIAGELLQKYHKPVIAISEGDEVSKASVRSVAGFNIIEFLRIIQEELLSVGGHPMAAGFSFESKKLEEIKKELFSLATEKIDPELLEKEIKIDCKLDHSLLDIETTNLLQTFAPFGMKNPQPVFLIENLQVVSKRELGKSGKHFKLFLQTENSDSIEALVWSKPYLVSEIDSGDMISVVVAVEKNVWNGRESVQLKVFDCKK